MTLNARLLCGTIATGESLSLRGKFVLMSPYLTIVANPSCTFACVSVMRYSRASVFLADGWAPYLRVSSICFWVQSGPQLTGQPEDA